MKLKFLPNILTGLRIIIVPVFISLFAAGNTELCAALFIISGLSDIADGFVARNFACESNLGKILDPIADKLTYASVIVCLYAAERIPLYFVVVYVVIQLLQGVGALFVYKSDKTVVKSNVPGKMAGFAMFAFSFANLVFYDYISMTFVNILSIAVLAIIIAASAGYFIQYIGFSAIGKSKKN